MVPTTGAETVTDTTTITTPVTKRARKGSVILTDRMCEKRVAQRIKVYDRKCPGLYVSITTAGVATFSFKFTDPATGKQRTAWLGVYNSETFTVEDARSKVYGLKGKGGEALAQTFREQKVQKAKQGKTVDEIIQDRIESWENVASHLRRFVSPTLGKKLATEVTKHDIAQLSNDIVAGKLGIPSISNARHMRRAASAKIGRAHV